MSVAFLSLVLVGTSCSSAPVAESAKQSGEALKSDHTIGPKAEPEAANPDSAIPSGALIEIEKDSPSDTVNVFYKRLRENRFKDALLLTNMRPAVEGLSETELADLGVDFKNLAASVPPQMPINGEIITGDQATVTIKYKNEKDGKPEVSELQLRKHQGFWQLVLADAEGEKRIRKEGKNYFFALRLDVHEAEAKNMLNRIAKAQAVYSLNNGGQFADLPTLVKKGYVPEDALSSASTGYNYAVNLAFDKSLYTATATPAEYGKSGKQSYALKIRRGAEPLLIEKDLKGAELDG
ncbi:MAG: hypothetical protein R2684_04375 [Pyrinomonadaceae bacterium]